MPEPPFGSPLSSKNSVLSSFHGTKWNEEDFNFVTWKLTNLKSSSFHFVPWKDERIEFLELQGLPKGGSDMQDLVRSAFLTKKNSS